MLTQAEFETLINDPEKVIDGDITWTQERSPRSGFRVEILSPAGYPLFLKGSYNPIIVALSYHIITAPATDPVRVWEQFCQEAKIHHNGRMDTPPPTQLDLFL
ncbi:hypothetical protein [Spirulina major]|uniref:hypothetical protein n=1 Tax=Spirulina major TaxID=270636 RepID=UPI0009335317|nr:hypothetical protein [Spirulina major]